MNKFHSIMTIALTTVLAIIVTACVPIADASVEEGATVAETTDLTVSEQKEMVRRYFEELWHQGNEEVIEELFHPNQLFTGPSSLGVVLEGQEGRRQLYHAYQTAFPDDLHFDLQEVVADGNKVVAYWIGTGTNTGPHFKFGDPTGKSVVAPGISIFTFEEGQIIDEIAIWDELYSYQQLGVKPPVLVEESGLTEAEQKKLILHYFDEYWNARNTDVISEIFTENNVFYATESSGVVLHGYEGREQLRAAYNAAWPDLHLQVETVVVDGNQAMVHWIGTATQAVEFMGVPPIGEPVSAHGMTVFTFANGRIETERALWDELYRAQQHGVTLSTLEGEE